MRLREIARKRRRGKGDGAGKREDPEISVLRRTSISDGRHGAGHECSVYGAGKKNLKNQALQWNSEKSDHMRKAGDGRPCTVRPGVHAYPGRGIRKG